MYPPYLVLCTYLGILEVITHRLPVYLSSTSSRYASMYVLVSLSIEICDGYLVPDASALSLDISKKLEVSKVPRLGQFTH